MAAEFNYIAPLIDKNIAGKFLTWARPLMKLGELTAPEMCRVLLFTCGLGGVNPASKMLNADVANLDPNWSDDYGIREFLKHYCNGVAFESDFYELHDKFSNLQEKMLSAADSQDHPLVKDFFLQLISRLRRDMLDA